MSHAPLSNYNIKVFGITQKMWQFSTPFTQHYYGSNIIFFMPMEMSMPEIFCGNQSTDFFKNIEIGGNLQEKINLPSKRQEHKEICLEKEEFGSLGT